MQHKTKMRAMGSVLAVAALLLSGCSSSDEAAAPAENNFPADSTMAKIAAKGKLVVGTAYDTPLFSVKDPTTGEIKGFDADFSRLVAEKLTGSADNIEWIETSGENRMPFIESGKVDIVIKTFTITAERDERIDFVGPYYLVGQDMLVRKDYTTVTKVEDLNDPAIKVCDGTGTVTSENIRKKAPNANITEVDDTNLCVEGVKDGRFDVYVDDDAYLGGVVALTPDEIKLVGAPFTQEGLGWGIGNNDTVFQTWLNDLLKTAIEDGTWRKYYDTSIGSVLGTEPQVPTVGVIP
jgi:glutamate transport system substrate-binding protein